MQVGEVFLDPVSLVPIDDIFISQLKKKAVSTCLGVKSFKFLSKLSFKKILRNKKK